MSDEMRMALLRKLPMFDPHWEASVGDRWFVCFTRLLAMAGPQTMDQETSLAPSNKD